MKFVFAAGIALVLGNLLFDRGADATIAAKKPPTSPVVPVPPADSVISASLPAPATQSAKPAPVPRIKAEAQVDLFAARSFAPPLPPPPPPPKPVAPPFPYAYGGAQRDGENITLYLKMGERNVIARQGDTLDGTYHVDEIANGVAVFTYLPLNEQQRLQIGNLN